jgi:protein-disulfide isomerase
MLGTGQKYAEDVLKVAGTPTFFVNGDMIVGEAAFEEFDKRIKTLLKN